LVLVLATTGLKGVGVTQEKTLPPGAPNIISFTTTLARISKGQRVILRWQTAQADLVVLGTADPLDPTAVLEPRQVAASSSVEVMPQETTIYRIKASNERGMSVLQQLTVEVIAPPAILSFTATPSRVAGGAAATLRWQVSNAEEIWISRDRRLDTVVRVDTASGEMRVTPERDATYQLHVRGGAEEVLQEVTIRVAQLTGVCTITGEIRGDKPEYATTVSLRVADSGKQRSSSSVDKQGRYRFSRVPLGTYHILPQGKYPNGKLAIGPRPARQEVACQPGGFHTANFEIVAEEG